MSGVEIAGLLLIGLWLVAGVIEFGLFVAALTARGQAAEAPGPGIGDGPVPDCDCEDCEYERDWAEIVQGLRSDA